MEEEVEIENEENLLPEGTFAVTLSKETQEKFEIVVDWQLSTLEPQKEIPLETLQADVQERKEESDFFQLKDQIMSCKLLAPLMIYDQSEMYGSEFLLCLSGEAKYGYLQNEEDSNMDLVDEDSPYAYKPPQQKGWDSLKSDQLIERDWVTDSRPKIRLQIKRNVARTEGSKTNFTDRNVDDVGDGYVACESYQDTHEWVHVAEMERAMQAVPILVEGSSQTELKHPKNLYTQYEPRVFTEEEVKTIWESPEMKKFLSRVEEIMNEVAEEPDIMGEFREDIEAFYLRDHVEVVEETELVEHLFFTDLNFSHNTRVTHLRWHPEMDGVVAMAVVSNSVYEEYLANLTKRLVMPNMLMIWSTAHPLFPQLLLRIPDDITVFEWHPIEPAIIIGGCMNGQVVVWDIGEYVDKLRNKACIWDHAVIMGRQTNQLHVEDGFVPVLYWSAESNVQYSHTTAIENFKWLPKNVWFSHESAFPKPNQNESQRQFITCAADNYILVWDMRKPPGDDLEGAVPMEEEAPRKSSKQKWAKLKARSTIGDPLATKKWSPAIGKYSFLNKIWRPVHKIIFIDPAPPIINPNTLTRGVTIDENPILKVLITALSVTDRPDLMALKRKTSVVEEPPSASVASKMTPATTSSSVAKPASSIEKSSAEDNESLRSSGRGSVDKGSVSEGGKEEEQPDPSNLALPTLLMAGTILGSVFRADLSKNKVDVETNNLMCKVQWITPVHDGPVRIMEKSPFLPHLLLTMGGYSFAIWNEGIMDRPVMLHFVDKEQFTAAAWSLEQPSIVFFSSDKGNLEVWDITRRKSDPIQTQNIAGRAINAICPYRGVMSSEEEGHFISVADNSGTLRMMKLPKHLWNLEGAHGPKTIELAVDDLQLYIDNEIAKKQEKERLRNDKERTRKLRMKKTIEEELDEDTRVSDTEEEYMVFYFRRERQVMQGLYGNDWKNFVRHKNMPREEYQIEESRRTSETSTISSQRRMNILDTMKGKSSVISPFLKP